ncbi:hypothetical protein B4099_1418 [Heyndrickxia coagulans]|uniref:Uncharacterized protein n=1 Tax=Heyndrickxia coagulans TaxID=1398 RepID=A0A150JTP5_HEYCO|nr:hypothetical protein B4099_1418 [Heyndrickxia coagulans]
MPVFMGKWMLKTASFRIGAVLFRHTHTWKTGIRYHTSIYFVATFEKIPLIVNSRRE